MKLLLLLFIISNFLLANNFPNLKLKTEKNRALILEQDKVPQFYPFIGNPWFEDEIFCKELLQKHIYTVRFINMPVYLYRYTGKTIRSDKNILLAFSKRNFYNYQPFKYASQSLKKDKEFVHILLEKNQNIYPYLDKSLQKDETIIQKYGNKEYKL